MCRLILCFVLSCLLCLGLTACGGKQAPPPEAMAVLTAMQSAMISAATPIPDGLIYTRAVPPTDPTYLTDPLFSALYGEAARGLLSAESEGESPAVGDAALFLSVAPYPCELAVFRCSDIRTASTVAGLCRGRLDTVSRGYAGSEWQAVAEGGRVVVEGCYVLLVIAEDTEAGVDKALEMVS